MLQPVLTVVEPLVERLTRTLSLDGTRGYPFVDRTDREFALFLAPAWSWSVRVRYRDSDVAVIEVRTEEAGHERVDALAAGDAERLERDLAEQLAAFAERARAAAFQGAPVDGL